MSSDKRQPGNSNNAKWVTIGICVIVFMFLFNDQISNILNHTAKVRLDKGGVTLETRTKILETPVGPARVSVIPVNSETVSAIEGIQGAHYVSKKDGFEISWPGDGSWIATEGLSPDAPLVLKRMAPIGLIAPTVEVKIIPQSALPFSSIRPLTDQALGQLQLAGVQILASSVDEATNSSFFTLSSTSALGFPMYVFQRNVIASGRVYIVTAGGVPTDEELTQKLKHDILLILNSFNIII